MDALRFTIISSRKPILYTVEHETGCFNWFKV